MQNYLSFFSRNKLTLLLFLAFLLPFLRLLNFVNKFSVNVLHWDQWDFLDGFFNNANIFELFFRQHGPHRQGLAAIYLKILYFFTNWDSQIEAFTAVIILLINAILALILKYRLFKKLDYFDIMIPIIFLTPFQYELLVGTQNPAHGILPIFLVLSISLLLSNRLSWTKVFLIGLINFVAIFTGFGLFSGIALFLANLNSRCTNFIKNKLHFFTLWTMILFAYAIFSIDYIFSPAIECFTFPYYPLVKNLDFIVVELGRGLGLYFRTTLAAESYILRYLISLGFLALLLYLVIKNLFSDAKQHEIAQVLIYLCSFSLLFFCFTTVGRVCAGIDGAKPSRYIPYTLPAIFGIYLFLRSSTFLPNKMLLIFLCLTLIQKEFYFYKEVESILWYAKGKQKWSTCFKKIKDINYCDKNANFQIYPSPTATNLVQKLEYLQKNKLNLFKYQEPKT